MPNAISRTVTVVKDLGTGYVRVSSGDSDNQSWAQLPKAMWEELLPGDLVPKQYTFEPRWVRLLKP